MKKLSKIINLILPVITLGCLLLLWSFASAKTGSDYILPSVEKTLSTLLEVLSSSKFYTAFAFTFFPQKSGNAIFIKSGNMSLFSAKLTWVLSIGIWVYQCLAIIITDAPENSTHFCRVLTLKIRLWVEKYAKFSKLYELLS